MWHLYLTAKAASARPSELAAVPDEWAAYCFDSAVAFVGLVIEGALQEMHNTGTEEKPKYEAKYTLKVLLDESFRLPPPREETVDFSPLQRVHGIKIEGL